MQAAQQHRQTHLGPGCCCAPCLYCSQGLAARGAYAARAHPLPAGPPGSAEEGGIQWGTAAHCFAMAAKVQYFAMAAEAHNFAVAGQAHSFAIALLVAPAPSEGALGLVKRRLWLCRRRATAWGGHNHWSAHLPGACNRLLHQGRGLGESCCCNRAGLWGSGKRRWLLPLLPLLLLPKLSAVGSGIRGALGVQAAAVLCTTSGMVCMSAAGVIGGACVMECVG
eukprot:1043030-Pelagomonas_calceolata.AAC.2